jgi:hypothetical protein
MSTTNYPSGSKLNPLSEDIHQRDVAHHNWMGGWVGTSDNPTYYDRQNEERTCNGSLSSPYDADVYDELTENGMWIGGWVLEEGESGGTSDSPTYITAESTVYAGEDEDGNVFGSEDNPIPIAVYEEMCELDIWTGGWVVYPNGTTEEFPENEGGASGSGSGSGCGCGCGNNDAGCGCGCGEDEGGSGCGGDGVSAGSITLYTHSVTLAKLLLSWTAGTITRDCTSELSLEFVTTGSSYVFDEISLSSEARWIGLYGVIYNYTLSFKYYDNGVWKEVQEVGNGELTIPTEYQNS